ncbi:carbohydrate-binding protein [Streptomyces sp. NPDC001292]|uniref:carbohydrate-binding protein n=1 Tax=Streptomyces sp. NPDC001292 TaxID=3364558 RepID=UPI0036CC05D8
MSQGRRRLEPGPYDLLVGASSEDLRLRTILTLVGEPGTPHPVLEHGLNALGFDEQSGIGVVDRTRTTGDAVTSSPGRPGELLHVDCDFGTGVTRVRVEVADEGTVELSLDGGPVLAVVTRDTPTSGPYDYTMLTAPATAAGVHDLRLGLHGPLRLARVDLTR